MEYFLPMICENMIFTCAGGVGAWVKAACSHGDGWDVFGGVFYPLVSRSLCMLPDRVKMYSKYDKTYHTKVF